MKLLLAGDVMTGRGIDQAMREPLPPVLYEPCVRDAREYVRLAERANGTIPTPVAQDYPWGDALAAMERLAPDLRIVNLETAITRSATPWPGKDIHYRMSPAHAGTLGAAHIDACTLANNHVMDWGAAGLADTLQALDAVAVAHAGAGADLQHARAPAVLPLPGGQRLLVFAWAAPDCGVPTEWAAASARPGVALLRRLDGGAVQDIADHVRRHRRAGDVVLVSLHWGANWVHEVPPVHREVARQLVECGAADVVHGHSSHHALPFEVHRGKLVLYGCGDLINDYEGIGVRGPWRSDVVCLYAVSLDAGSGRLRALQIVPLQLRRLRLGTPSPSAFKWLLRHLVPACERLGSHLQATMQDPWRLAWVPRPRAPAQTPAAGAAPQ